MNPALHTSTATSAAVAAAHKRQAEEEEMTPYRAEDLAGDWEFKILRSATGAFKDPEKLRQALDEESRAGWQLVEKFDNARLRLKRSGAARENDAMLEFDPYRTTWGVSDTKLALAIVVSIFGLLAMAVAIIAIANQ